MVFIGGGDADFQKAQGISLGINIANVYSNSGSSESVNKLYSGVSRGVSRRRDNYVISGRLDSANRLDRPNGRSSKNTAAVKFLAY